MNEKSVSPEMPLLFKDRFPRIQEDVDQHSPELIPYGDGWCCISGGNLSAGISGTGKTKEEALEDWAKSLEASREANRL